MSKVPEKVRKELAALAAKPETEIDLSDMPETTSAHWVDAERGKFYRPIKQQLTVRLDADVLAWLKEQGEGYQTRMNAILRAEMLKSSRR
ncbi:BrnA antitoxin family protein [Cupriavidus sp. PET2-C1]